MGRRIVSTPTAPKIVSTELKLVPNQINEQVVISSALIHEPTRANLLKRVSPDYFQYDDNRRIWAGLQELERKKLKYDPATLLHAVGDKGIEIQYLIYLERSRTSPPPELEHHVASLLWDHKCSQAVQGPFDSLAKAFKNREDPDRIQSLAKQLSEVLHHKGELQYIRNSAELLRATIASYEARELGIAHFPFGFDGLDYYSDEEVTKLGLDNKFRMVPGLAPETITLVVGLSGSGKSTFICNLILAQIALGKKILMGAWEMGGTRTLEMLAGIALGFRRTDVKLARLPYEQKLQLFAKMAELSNAIIFFDNPFGRRTGDKATNEGNLDCIQRNIEASGCDIAIFDLWKRCLVRTKPEDEEAAMFRQQSMAQETKAACVLVHQLTLKEVEKRADRKPTREGVKGSGAYTETPDNMLGIHNPAKHKDVPGLFLEVDVLKQRDGEWPLAVEMNYDAKTGRIYGGKAVPYNNPIDTQQNSSDAATAGALSERFRKKSR